MEASTGIEPVYTDLQSAASPLRQLASDQCENVLTDLPGGHKWLKVPHKPQFTEISNATVVAGEQLWHIWLKFPEAMSFAR